MYFPCLVGTATEDFNARYQIVVKEECVLNDGEQVFGAFVTTQVCLVCFSSCGYCGN